MDRNIQVTPEQKMFDESSSNRFSDRGRSELYENLMTLPPVAGRNEQQRLIENGTLPDLCLSDSNPFDGSRELDNAQRPTDPDRTLDNADHSTDSNKRLNDAQRSMTSNGGLNGQQERIESFKKLEQPMHSDRRQITTEPGRRPEQTEQKRNLDRPETMLDPSRRPERFEQRWSRELEMD